MDELNSLEDEIAQEDTESEAIPAYLVNAASASKNTVNNAASPDRSMEVETDEFGLPKVPQRNLA